LAAEESYPDDLKYHREHDWARVDGDEALLGITWFAQDALGELVHFEAPEVRLKIDRAAIDEAFKAWVIPTMFAKVARGDETAENAAKAAEDEYKRIFARWK